MSARYTPKRLNRSYSVVLFLIGVLFVSGILLNMLLFAKLEQAFDIAEEAIITAREAQEMAKSSVKTEQVVEELPEEPLEPTEETSAVENELVEEVVEETAEVSEPQPTGTRLVVDSTAYCPCPICCGIWSEQHPDRIGTDYKQVLSSGLPPVEGRTIATDPTVIPLGTKVFLNGNTYVAEDTGGGVKGYHIDIFFDTHEEALAWGRQTVEVLLIEE